MHCQCIAQPSIFCKLWRYLMRPWEYKKTDRRAVLSCCSMTFSGFLNDRAAVLSGKRWRSHFSLWHRLVTAVEVGYASYSNYTLTFDQLITLPTMRVPCAWASCVGRSRSSQSTRKLGIAAAFGTFIDFQNVANIQVYSNTVMAKY